MSAGIGGTHKPDPVLERWAPWLQHLIPHSNIVAAAAGGSDADTFEWGPDDPDLTVLTMLAAEPELREGLVRAGMEGIGRVVDIGCGPGVLTRILAELVGGDAVGLDYAPVLLEFARTLPAPSCGAMSFEEADFNAGLPFADGEFDAAFIGDLWRSTPFAESRRVTRPGGRVVVKLSNTMPDLTYPWDLAFDLRMQLAVVAGAHGLKHGGRSTSESAWEIATAFERACEWRTLRTFTLPIERVHPIPAVFEEAELQSFARLVGPLIRDVVSDDEWATVAALWDPCAEGYVFHRPGARFLRTVTFLVGELPE